MGEVDLAAPVLNLGETGELRAVVHRNGLKDLRELVPKLFLEQLHGTQNGVSVLAGNMEGNVERTPSQEAGLPYPGGTV